MQQANPTLTAVVQLSTLIIVLAAIVVLAVSHSLHEQAVAALVGGILAHSGIIAYNGATKGTPTQATYDLTTAVQKAATAAIDPEHHSESDKG